MNPLPKERDTMKEWFYKTEVNWRTGRTERKFDWEVVAGIFIVLFVAVGLIVLLSTLNTALQETGEMFARQNYYHSQCLAHGYSDYKGDAVGNYYCYRIVNGTEELVPVERVIE